MTDRQITHRLLKEPKDPDGLQELVEVIMKIASIRIVPRRRDVGMQIESLILGKGYLPKSFVPIQMPIPQPDERGNKRGDEEQSERREIELEGQTVMQDGVDRAGDGDRAECDEGGDEVEQGYCDGEHVVCERGDRVARCHRRSGRGGDGGGGAHQRSGGGGVHDSGRERE